MDLNYEYNRLVKFIKQSAKDEGVKITNEEIAKRLGINRTYLSALLSGKEEVKEKHVILFKEKFKDELAGIVKPSEPGDSVNRERALIKVLMHRVAKLESERLGISVQSVLAELEKDTMIAWRDLEQGSAKS